MNLLLKSFVLSLLAMVLVACGGEEEGLPSQGEGGEAAPTIVSLQVTPATANVPVGFGQQFTAIAILSDGSTLDVTNDAALSWTSSDGNTASIISGQSSGNGLAKGETPGEVTITASGTANGTPFSASAQLEVTNAVVTALQVTPVTATVPDGLEQQFTAVAILSDGSTRPVTNDAALSWTSSDPATATIVSNQASGNGLAKGEKPGTVTITASGTANGTPFSASAQLEVTNAVVTDLQVTSVTATVPVGLELQFTATAILSDGSTRNVTNDAALSWSSSDTGIATIMGNGDSKSGIAHGESPGNVTITATITSNGTLISAVENLEVTDAEMTDLTITPENTTVAVGLGRQFDAIATFSDGSTLSVNDSSTIWDSFDTSIATITEGQASGNGLATGIRAGNVQIKAEVFDSISGYRFSDVANLEVKPALDLFTHPDMVTRKFVDADAYCYGLGLRLPTVEELQNLFIQSTDATEIGDTSYDLCRNHGRPLDGSCDGKTESYWTHDPQNPGQGGVNSSVSLNNGTVYDDSTQALLHVACVSKGY